MSREAKKSVSYGCFQKDFTKKTTEGLEYQGIIKTLPIHEHTNPMGMIRNASKKNMRSSDAGTEIGHSKYPTGGCASVMLRRLIGSSHRLTLLNRS